MKIEKLERLIGVGTPTTHFFIFPQGGLGVETEEEGALICEGETLANSTG